MPQFKFTHHEPPPEPIGRPPDPLIDAYARALRDRPGEWSPWPYDKPYKTLSSIASKINRQPLRAPHSLRQGFEARMSDGELYVRYVGD